MMDQGSDDFTAHFSRPGSLEAGTTIELDAALRRRNNAQKRNSLAGFDADGNELFRLRVNAPTAGIDRIA